MDIVGAIATRSKTIYFCRYNDTDKERALYTKFVKGSKYAGVIDYSDIKILAVESSDKMQNELKMVGFAFYDIGNNTNTVVTLDKYEELCIGLWECL